MGSERFYAKLPSSFDINHLKAAIILDLIGHDIMVEGREEAVLAIGVDSAAGLSAAVSAAGEQSELEVYRFGQGIAYSDHIVFERNEKPFVFLSSGMAWHYHTQYDTPQILNYEKMDKLAAFIAQFVTQLSLSAAQQNGQATATIDKGEPVRELVRFFGPALDRLSTGNNLGPVPNVRQIVEQKLQTAPGMVNSMLERINGVLLHTKKRITLDELLKKLIG
jgi:hypothetical protein